MPRLLAALIATTALVSAACGNGSSSESSSGGGGGDLTGVTWVLDHASMMTLTADMPDDAEIDIAFDGSQASGRAACNQYGGGYEADSGAGTLTFSDLASTQMACDGPLMALEAAYLAALGNVTTYEVLGDGKWLLLTAGNKALTYVAQQPMEALPLEGTAWTLTTIATPDTQAVSSTIAGTKVTARFDAGDVSGSGGLQPLPRLVRGGRGPESVVRPGRIHEDDVRAGRVGSGAGVLRRAGRNRFLRDRRRPADPVGCRAVRCCCSSSARPSANRDAGSVPGRPSPAAPRR